MSRITVVILIILALLIPSAAVAAWFYAQRALPSVDGVVSVPDLVHPADVRYDERGVPYIQAKMLADAYVAQGFVTASERMFQMDILRRTAKGELAEVFGPGSVAHDKLARSIGFNRLAQEELKQLPADMKALVEAYSRGVNNYLDFAAGRMPLEFMLLGYQPQQWQAADSLAILKFLQYEEEESWQLDDLRQRVIDKSNEKMASALFEQNLKSTSVGYKPNDNETRLISEAVSLLHSNGILPSSLPLWGSNAWSISGSNTDSHGSLLAFDSHSAFTSPDKFFVCSMSTTSVPPLHVAGATIPGVPGVMNGRNDYIAFGATALHADTQDLVIEQLSPQFPGKYKTRDGWENLKEQSEQIAVRNVPGFGKNVTQRALTTRHGPVLLQDDKTAVTLNWTGLEAKEPFIKTIFALNRARSWQEFNTALSTYSGPGRTFVFADRQGNIGYHAAGNLPIRSSAGVTVTPGWTGEADWQGRVKFDDMAHGFNPAQGYAIADHPLFAPSSYYNNPLRAIRIGNVLAAYTKANQKIGLPEMAVLQSDVVAPLAPLVKRQIEAAMVKTQVIDAYETNALAQLKQWDGKLSSDSSAATIYESFLRTLTRRVLEPRYGAKITQEYLQRWPRWTLFAEKILETQPKEWLPPGERLGETFLVTTLGESLKNVRLATKSDDLNKMPWQSLHQIRFRSLLTGNGLAEKIFAPLWRVNPIGAEGDQDTVNACNVTATIDPWNFTCDSGPTFRMLVDMADSDKFYASLPLGESGHLFSPYKTDQLRDWMRGTPHSIAFSVAQIDKQEQHKVFLSDQ